MGLLNQTQIINFWGIKNQNSNYNFSIMTTLSFGASSSDNFSVVI